MSGELKQILPILFIENKKEKAIVIGFWNKNIAFVRGSNHNPIIASDIEEEKGKVELNKKLNTLLPFVIMIILGVVAVYAYKKYKNR